MCASINDCAAAALALVRVTPNQRALGPVKEFKWILMSVNCSDVSHIRCDRSGRSLFPLHARPGDAASCRSRFSALTLVHCQLRMVNANTYATDYIFRAILRSLARPAVAPDRRAKPLALSICTSIISDSFRVGISRGMFFLSRLGAAILVHCRRWPRFRFRFADISQI